MTLILRKPKPFHQTYT